jgi:hypothetical protein
LLEITGGGPIDGPPVFGPDEYIWLMGGGGGGPLIPPYGRGGIRVFTPGLLFIAGGGNGGAMPGLPLILD